MKRRNTILVVAHPDDEILWFSSILPEVDRVIVAFLDYAAEPDLGDRRRRALAALPYANVASLAIPESGSLSLADWKRPELSPYGLRLTAAASDVAVAYERNFQAVESALARELTAATEVFTHNPWGEYGHEDHVQIYRAIEGLQMTMDFRLFVPGYVSKHALPFASTYLPLQATRRHKVDARFVASVARIYKEHGCWTWAEDWMWPDMEWFFRGPFKFSTSEIRKPARSPLVLLPSPPRRKIRQVEPRRSDVQPRHTEGPVSDNSTKNY